MMKRASIGPVVVAAFAAALVWSCKIEGERRVYRALGPGVAALRDAFNAEVGKVRLILLVAPT